MKASLGINSAGVQQDTSSLMHTEHLNSAMIYGVTAYLHGLSLHMKGVAFIVFFLLCY